jgi:PAS domain S-box-containing protein
MRIRTSSRYLPGSHRRVATARATASRNQALEARIRELEAELARRPPAPASASATDLPSGLLSVAGQLPLLLFRLDRSGSLSEVSGRGFDLLRSDDGRWLREPLPRSFPELAPVIARALAGETVCAQVRGCFEGHAWSVVVVMQPDGAGVVGAALDVAHLQGDDPATLAERYRFEHLMDRVPVGIVRVDTSGRVVYANRAVRVVAAEGPEALPGAAWLDFVHPADHERIFGLYSRSLAQSRSGRALIRVRDKQGDQRWVVATAVPERDADGTTHGYLVTMVDVHERVLAEESIRRANAELEVRIQQRTESLRRTNEELAAFTYTVSHDLRGPLHTISGFLELLDQEEAPYLSTAGRGYLARARTGVAHLSELLQDLLDLSRVQSRSLRREHVDMTELASEVSEELRMQNADRSVHVELEDGMECEADPTLLRDVLRNLLGNAWKFTAREDEPCIVVGSRPAGDSSRDNGQEHRVFFVRDNGTGVPAKDADRIFRPFESAHDRREYPGTGIGLAAVRRIVERHGGHIWVEPAPEHGATFCFELPTAPH